MRISFNLIDGPGSAPVVNPSVFYNPLNNELVFHHRQGGATAVALDDFDFTLHEKCEMVSPSVTNITQGEIGAFSGVQLSMKQLVELVDAARGA